MAPPQQQPRLVNKQFNSPIGLYSEQNIKEVIERESAMLANGAIGINFQNPSGMTKPANLHNSAVLRMLEEEEGRQRNGQITGVKRVAWPPPKDESEEAECDFVEQEAVQAQGGAQFTTSKPSLHYSNNQQAPIVAATSPFSNPQPIQQQQQQQSPLIQANQPAWKPQPPVQERTYSPVAQPAWRPISSPQPQSQPQPQYQPQQQSEIVWKPASVQQPKPISSQPNQREEHIIPIQIESGLNSKFENPAGRPQGQTGQQQPQQQSRPTAPAKQQVAPPPSLITLRPTVPISQAPAPVFASQPATATLRGGKNLRGDMKWPPENVKEKMEAENRMLQELAKGPACRPKKVAKDYSGFFAQHALNSSYPGYKVPPGTQYYEHHPVM